MIFIIDEPRLAAESGMFHRLCNGLLAESVQITRIVPEDVDVPYLAADDSDASSLLSPCLRATMRSPFWLRAHRRQRVMMELERTRPSGIVGFGRQTWVLAANLARVFHVPLALEVHSIDDLDALTRTRMGEHVRAFLAASGALADRASIRYPVALTCHVPPGVNISDPPHGIDALERAPFVTVLGRSTNGPAFEAFAIALRDAIADRPDAHVFMELEGPRAHETWRTLRRLELISRITILDRAAHWHSLLARCDVLAIPEPQHAVRSLVAEAMGGGALVIAAADAVQDMLIEGRTARIIEQASSGMWQAALALALDGHESTHAIRASAREYVRQEHRSSRQVQAMLEALTRMSALEAGSDRFPM